MLMPVCFLLDDRILKIVYPEEAACICVMWIILILL
jgi:hypothetical protein